MPCGQEASDLDQSPGATSMLGRGEKGFITVVINNFIINQMSSGHCCHLFPVSPG